MSDQSLFFDGLKNQPVNDYFVEKDGLRFAGFHLLVEFWGAENLNDVSLIEEALCHAAELAGATVLSIHAHRFSPSGVTGVAILEESHISIHTWPEHGFAAIDIFMCGNCQPYAAIGPLKEAFVPDKVMLSEHKRGMLLGTGTSQHPFS
ncbi:MAG: adenosylmethionine decarboxylase [Sedimenticola sp.]